jgi:hypothetical protein
MCGWVRALLVCKTTFERGAGWGLWRTVDREKGVEEVEVEERERERDWCGVRRVGLTTRHSFFDRSIA